MLSNLGDEFYFSRFHLTHHHNSFYFSILLGMWVYPGQKLDLTYRRKINFAKLMPMCNKVG